MTTEIDKHEIARRRTFAIISHPDAGKTTLTEKLLLYGGALQLAGSVRARRNQRATTSDWMELERQRGISVSSTVLQFEYGGFCVNLLDTPGHRDFSEDTYRVLTAVDSALMVIDAGKGIESQTRKLFEVCRQRGIPIFTFMNKLDRPALDPMALIDELEDVLGLRPYPVNWPLGSGDAFKGVVDRRTREVVLFDRVPGGSSRATAHVHDLYDDATIDADVRTRIVNELELLDGAGTAFDYDAIAAGEVSPVYFGSAVNNFGVQFLLDSFLDLAPPPGARAAGTRTVRPEDPGFAGFIFKIQANMDPNHRDRLAFVRVCSGRFERDMAVVHTRTGRRMRLARSLRLFGRDRETVDHAYPGDVVGVIGRGDLRIGDTFAEDASLSFDAIPAFAPECFAWIENPDPAHQKRFRRGLDQLLEEGVVQRFELTSGETQRASLLGAVGPLQFEVVQYRLESEYGATSRMEQAPWTVMRWVVEGELGSEEAVTGARRALDTLGRTVALFRDRWNLQYFTERNPKIRLASVPPNPPSGSR